MNPINKKLTAALLCGTILSATGCQTLDGMSKKDMGTAMGTVGGALLGSAFGSGSGKIMGVLLGAVVGGVIGNMIGAALDAADAAEVQKKSVAALENSKDGETISWSNPDTKVHAKLTPLSTKSETRNMKIARLKTVEAPSNLQIIGKPYETKGSKLNVRVGPSTSKPIATTIMRGEVVTAVGKVEGTDWILVAREGKAFGYVHGDYVTLASKVNIANAIVEKKAKVAKIETVKTDPDKTLRKTAVINLDALEGTMRAENAVDLDALFQEDNDVVVEEVASITECRQLEADISTENEKSTDTFTACKAADGAWVLS